MDASGYLVAALVLNLASFTKGISYSCSPNPVFAYSPSGSFQRAASDSSSPCSLIIPPTLFSSSQTRVAVTVEYFNSTSGTSCNDEHLLINNIRKCAGIDNSVTVIDVQTDAVHIIFSSALSPAQTTFLLHYMVYEDICITTDIIETSPVILRSSNGAVGAENCGLTMDVSAFDKIIVTPTYKDWRSEACRDNDVLELRVETLSGVRLRICQNNDCLGVEGFDVASYKYLKVYRGSAHDCNFYWKIDAFSRNTVQDICSLTGNDLTLPEGKISSPGYPNGFNGSLNCSVSISGFDAVTITIMYYNLKKRICSIYSTNPCDCGDRLIINHTAKCGEYSRTTSRTYFGSDIPLSLQLVTKSRRLGSNNGFYLTYKGYAGAEDICDDSATELTLPLLLKSPNFPNRYPDNKHCERTIDISQLDSVEILLISFSLEDASLEDKCSYDYLSINGVRYCGKKDGHVHVLDTRLNTLTILFRSDVVGSSTGFYLSIKVRPSTTLPTTITTTPVTTSTPSTTTATTTTTSTSTNPITAAVTSSGVSDVDNTAMRTQSSQTSTAPAVTESFPRIPPVSHRTMTAPVEEDEQTISYSEVTDKPVNVGSDSEGGYVIPLTTAVTKETGVNKDTDSAQSGADRSCGVPWYYWIVSLIAVLLAVFITVAICLIKLKRLKIYMAEQHSYADTEGSRDGLANPVFYNNSHLTHGKLTTSSPCYTNNDPPLAGTRVVFNKNSVQTTV